MGRYRPRHAGPVPPRGPGQESRHNAAASDVVAPARSSRHFSVVAAGMLVIAVGAALTVAALLYDNSGRTLHPAAAALRQHPATATAAKLQAKHAYTRARSSSPPGHQGATPPTPASSGATAPTSTKRRAGGASPATTGQGQPAPTTGGLAMGNPATSTSPAEDLPVPAGFGPLLRHLWVAANPGGTGIEAADVRSTAPGSVFYAEQPTIGTYWAVSSFVPTARAEALTGTTKGVRLLAQFHMTAVFERTAVGKWAYVGEVVRGTCASSVPAPVFSAWGMCTAGRARTVGS